MPNPKPAPQAAANSHPSGDSDRSSEKAGPSNPSKSKQRRDRSKAAKVKAQDMAKAQEAADAKCAKIAARDLDQEAQWISDAKKVRSRVVNAATIHSAGFMALPGAKETLKLLEVNTQFHVFGSNFSPAMTLEQLTKIQSKGI